MPAPRPEFPPDCCLFHGSTFGANGLREPLEAAAVELRATESILSREIDRDAPTVIVIDAALAGRIHERADLPEHVIVAAGDAVAAAALGDGADLSLATVSAPRDRLLALRMAFQLSAERRAAARCEREERRLLDELSEMHRIGAALMMERDRDTLLNQILEQAMRFTGSDAGVLFLVEKDAHGLPLLRFTLAKCESLTAGEYLGEVTFPFDSTSLVGHSALTRRPLVLADVQALPADAPYRFNRLLSERLDYPVRSTLTIPMLNQRGDVVGVLQLANRKADPAARIATRDDADRCVIPYSDRDVRLGFSLAGQAAVSIDNARLYSRIEDTMESFVKAAVSAIDQRDPSTAGHAIRVATLVTDLAAALRSSTTKYRTTRFTRAQTRELHYAALLHDCGKLGVREEVLVKPRKLPAVLWERVQGRFDLIRCILTLEYERKRRLLPVEGREAALAALDSELIAGLRSLDRLWGTIRTANEPTLLPEAAADGLADATRLTFRRLDGRIESYLSEEELSYLQIAGGSLTAQERDEIEAHARHTFLFLSKIHWTEDLQNVARYAAAHHEKLNGTGYPERLGGERIAVQTRLITIADIFDALTAADRPYKHAVAPETALDILQSEARAGLLDADLVHVMIESQVYRHILDEDWHHL